MEHLCKKNCDKDVCYISYRNILYTAYLMQLQIVLKIDVFSCIEKVVYLKEHFQCSKSRDVHFKILV